MVDRGADPQAYGRRLRLTLAAEHLDREVDSADRLPEVMGDCVAPEGLFTAYAEAAAGLDAWWDGGRVGPRPPGRLRRLQPPGLSRMARTLALPVYLTLHDPDGRPRSLRRTDAF